MEEMMFDEMLLTGFGYNSSTRIEPNINFDTPINESEINKSHLS